MQSTGKFYYNYLFWPIPIGCLLIATLYIQRIDSYFLLSCDPEFAYLFNGITLAHLHPDLNCVGHPGTPIQCLIAMVSWVVHLFRPGSSLWDDVLKNPDLYIKASLYTANFINAIVLFALGKYVNRYIGSILPALVLQITPFAYLITLEVTNRLMPELIMISILSCWIMFLIRIIYEQEKDHNYKKYAVIFALLFGFSLADKLTFLPFFVLPFTILPGWRLKFRYTAFSIFFFLLFAFPVLFNFNKFIGWVTAIFVHKGAYGGGDTGIVDWGKFLVNIKTMINNTKQLLIPLSFLIIATLWYRFIKKRKDVVVSISAGLFLVFLIQYIITAKHYAFYYMTPTLLLTVFTGFMVFVFLNLLFSGTRNRIIFQIVFACFGASLLFYTLPKTFRELHQMRYAKGIRFKAYHEIAPLIKAPPKIICPEYYGCSSIEYGLTFGLQESGRYGTSINELVKKLYPETFMYYSWSNEFYEGIHNIKPSQFIKPAVDYTVYISNFSKERLKQILNAITSDLSGVSLDTNQIYNSPATSEAVYKLTVRRNEDIPVNNHAVPIN